MPLCFDRNGFNRASIVGVLGESHRPHKSTDRSCGAKADVSELGDSLMLDHKFNAVPASEIGKLFGEKFAAKVAALAPGQWQGSIDSGYGVHLVFVSERANGRLPASFVAEAAPAAMQVAATYLKRGVEHILGGFDHLLFVLALLILVSGTRRLILTVTAFTLVAFAFGLLHGFRFVSALNEVGPPQTAIPEALLFFSVGVEIGQLLFIASVLAVIALARQVTRCIVVPQPAWGWRVPPSAIGSVAMFWVLQRLFAF